MVTVDAAACVDIAAVDLVTAHVSACADIPFDGIAGHISSGIHTALYIIAGYVPFGIDTAFHAVAGHISTCLHIAVFILHPRRNLI